jgi:hypothetical protein
MGDPGHCAALPGESESQLSYRCRNGAAVPERPRRHPEGKYHAGEHVPDAPGQHRKARHHFEGTRQLVERDPAGSSGLRARCQRHCHPRRQPILRDGQVGARIAALVAGHGSAARRLVNRQKG